MSKKTPLITKKRIKGIIGSTGLLSTIYSYASIPTLIGIKGVITASLIGIATTLIASIAGGIGTVAGLAIGLRIAETKKSRIYERRGWVLGSALLLGSIGFITGATQGYEPSKEISIKSVNTISNKLDNLSIQDSFEKASTTQKKVTTSSPSNRALQTYSTKP